MEPVDRDKYTTPGTVVSEWDTAVTTIATCTTWCSTSLVLLTTAYTTRSKPAAGTRHTICWERKWERQWYTDYR